MKHKTDQQPNWNRLEHEPDQNTPKTCSNITEHQKQKTELAIHYLAIQRSNTFDLCTQRKNFWPELKKQNYWHNGTVFD